MRIRDKNKGTWPPQSVGPDGNTETKGTLLDRTGALMRSITATPINGGVQIGTNLRTPDGGYNIGRLMQYGTGPIEAKSGKLLCFEINGVKIFTKRTKGIPARPFLFLTSDDAQRVMGVFESYIMGGVSGA